MNFNIKKDVLLSAATKILFVFFATWYLSLYAGSAYLMSSDSSGYIGFKFDSLSSILSQMRTFGYPTFLRLNFLIFGGYYYVPFFQAFICLIAGIVLYFGLLKTGFFGLLKTGFSKIASMATVLPILVALHKYHAYLMTDSLGFSLAILSCGILLNMYVRKNSKLLYLLYGTSVFLSYQVRPLYLYLIFSLPLAISAFIIFKNGILKFKSELFWVKRVFLIGILPFLFFSFIRLIVVGNFGLVSFAGICSSGLAGEIVSEDTVKKLPVKHRLFAQMFTNERMKWKWDTLPTNPETGDFERGILYGYYGYKLDTALPGFNISAWRVAVPLVTRLEDGLIRQNNRLSSFSRSVFIADSGLFRSWIWTTTKDIVVKEVNFFFALSVLFLFFISCLFFCHFYTTEKLHYLCGFLLGGFLFFVIIGLSQMAVTRMFQPFVIRYQFPIDGFLFASCGAIINFIVQLLKSERRIVVRQPINSSNILPALKRIITGKKVLLLIIILFSIASYLFYLKFSPMKYNATYIKDKIKQNGNISKFIDLKNKITPMHLAAIESRADVVSMLISAGHNPEQTDRDGFTPLHYAASAGSLQVLDVLLGEGMSIDINFPAGKSKLTALHLAKNYETVKLLLQYGAKPNVSDCHGSTPLHWADDPQAISFLIAHGAKTNAFLHRMGGYHFPQTPLAYAFKRNDNAAIKALLPHSNFKDIVPAAMVDGDIRYRVMKYLKKK